MNTRRILLMMALGLLGSLVSARAIETFLLVRMQDRDGAEHVEIMSPAELRALQANIALEAKLFPKALAASEAQWTKDEKNTKPFPKSAIHRRSATVTGQPFTDRTKAEDKLSRIAEHANLRLAEEQDQEKARLRERYKGEQRKAKLTQMETEEALRKAAEEKARTLYEQQLEQLMGTNAPAASAPKPAAL